MGDVVVEESSHPFQVSFHPCFHAAPCHRKWIDLLPLLVAVQARERRAVRRSRQKKKKRQTYRRGSAEKEGHGGSHGPLPWPCGAASVVAFLTLRRFVPSSFLSLAVSSLPSVFSGGLTASASLCCPHYAEMDVERKMRRLICFLHLHLVFVKLRASMPCNPPVLFTAPCEYVTAAISWFLHLAHVLRTNQEGLFQCFFDRARFDLSAFAIGRSVGVACNDVCKVFLGDFPELAQKLLCNVGLRRRVAQVRGDGCVHVALLLRPPPKP